MTKWQRVVEWLVLKRYAFRNWLLITIWKTGNLGAWTTFPAGCRIFKGSAKLKDEPFRGDGVLWLVKLDGYVVVPRTELENPMRRCRIIFDLLCPDVQPNALNDTPEQRFYQALVDNAHAERRAFAAVQAAGPGAGVLAQQAVEARRRQEFFEDPARRELGDGRKAP